jgi:hypothetical protein
MIEFIIFVFGICGVSYYLDKCNGDERPQNENIDKIL